MINPALFRQRLLDRLAAARRSAAPVAIDDSAVTQLAHYYDRLSHWNRRINLTALPLDGVPDAAIDRLIVEPIIAAHLLAAFAEADAWADVGSGGGSPALPLKIVTPSSRLTMIESRSRKAAFLRTVVGDIGITQTYILNARIEEAVRDLREKFAIVTTRGLRIDDQVSTAVSALLVADGKLLVFISTGQGHPRCREFTVEDEVPLIDGVSALLVLHKRR